MANIYYKGYDCRKIPRIYGIFPSMADAKQDAIEHAREYINRRRDTGPLSAWKFTYSEHPGYSNGTERAVQTLQKIRLGN